MTFQELRDQRAEDPDRLAQRTLISFLLVSPRRPIELDLDRAEDALGRRAEGQAGEAKASLAFP